MSSMGLKPNYTYLGRKYNLDPRTIKKYFNGYEGKPSHRNKPSKLEEYDEIIKEKLLIPGVTKAAIFFFLQEKYQYSGSYSGLTYHIRHYENYRPLKQKGHDRYETDIGEVIQFDWVEDLTLVNSANQEFNFNVFSAELTYSRMHFFCYSITKTREDVYRCLIESFKFFGGITEGLLTDNMSSIVDTKKLKFFPEFITFAKDMGFLPCKCKPHHPFTKGKVEVRNKFMGWLLPFNNSFDTEDEIIGIIKKINIKVNDKINDTTGVKPILLYMKEKEYLKPLPNNQIIEHYMNFSISVKVQNTSLFRYKGKDYSVPPKYINHTLKIREEDNKLYVYSNTDLVAIHEISDNPINYLKDHYVEVLKGSMPNKSEDEIEKCATKNLELLGSLVERKKEVHE